MSPRLPDGRAALAAGSGVAILVGVAAATAWRDASPVGASPGGHHAGDAAWSYAFVGLLVAAFALYVAGLALVRRRRAVAAWVVAVGLAVQVAPLAGPLLLSTDVWTYWGYARLEDPYTQTPAEARDDEAFRWVGERWHDTESVYGPGFSLLTEPIAAIDSAVAVAWLFRVLAAALMCACVLLAARAGPLAAAFVGWNPVVAVHAAGGGHNDVWIGAAMIGALGLAARGRSAPAGAALALGALVKWVPLVALPLHALAARRKAATLVGFAAAAAAGAGLATVVYGTSWVDAFGPLARNAADTTSFALPHRVSQLGVPRGVAVAVFAAVFVVGYALLAREAWRGRARVGAALALLLACSPYVTPWYLAWLVPVAAVEDDDTAKLAALAFTAYLLPQTVHV